VVRRERPRRSTQSQQKDPYTLIVALDATGQAAQGRLYIDDGRSFAYVEGQYVDAAISFEDGQTLKYVPKHVGIQYSFTFERVVVLGWHFKSPMATYSAQYQETAAVVEVSREAFGGSSDKPALVYRSPKTPVSEPWTLVLSES
jgi:mannosyl-oligosaccharide alpha-1,3-glucosidase